MIFIFFAFYFNPLISNVLEKKHMQNLLRIKQAKQKFTICIHMTYVNFFYFGVKNRPFAISCSSNLCSRLRLKVRRNQFRKRFVTFV
jgi:hypothetical protein